MSSLPSLLTRGVHEVLPSAQTLADVMAKRKIRLYLGIDPTGAFLTLGHAVALRKLQQFADAGHDVILLIGNGTVRIGDPTGRDSTRPVLTDEQIEANFQDWKRQASKVIDFDKIRILHNGDWLDKLSFAELVKLMAQTTVQQLIERDMFQKRLENGQPIFGHEIMYPLLQGYDSVAMEVDLEIGGTDQTFNMMMGRHLLQSYKQKEKWVLSTPIINGTDGRKMSKSYGNYVALTDEPNDMYGKLMSVSDEEIVPYFELLTDVSDEDLANIRRALADGANPMTYKKQLAHAITTWLHSSTDADAAQVHFEKTVQQKQIPDELAEVRIESNPEQPLTALALAKACLPEESNSQLRRLIDQGAMELLPAHHKPANAEEVIDASQLDIVRLGKRQYFKIIYV